MSLSLIVGPPNSGRAEEIVRRLEGALPRGPVLVVPTGDDVTRFERDLCERRGVVLGASISNFRGLAGDVAGACGAGLRPELSTVQRLALVRAAIRRTELRVLRRAAPRRGFAVALERLLGELQAALVGPEELRDAAGALSDGGYERELAALYRAYVEAREAVGLDDPHSSMRRTVAALRQRHQDWGNRPVFVYGFDDLTEEQLDLVDALARACEVTVAVNYADREALAARAGLYSRLVHDLGGTVERSLPFDPGYTTSATLRHLDQALFEPAPEQIDPDDGLVLLRCAGGRGEAEAIGAEIARLITEGVQPDEIVVVLREPDRHGPLYERVLRGLGIPISVEAEVPLSRTTSGRRLAALIRAASPDGTAEDVLALFRARSSFPPSVSDWLERRIRRSGPLSASEATEGWEQRPRMLEELRRLDPRAGGDRRDWLRAFARGARELAEEAHRRREPVEGQLFDPLELRAAHAAASALEQLAELELPGDQPAFPDEAVAMLDELTVPLWWGSTEGTVRVLDPYRVRVARARHLFCAALQDGEFPRSGPGDPLLGDERRAALGIQALIRQDPAEEERYLFHACASRPTERLWLSWRSCDEEGLPAARSPFLDDLLDLIAPEPESAERSLTRERGLEQVVFEPAQAPTSRELARSLAALAGDGGDPLAALDALELPPTTAARILALVENARANAERPPPTGLRAEAVLAALRERPAIGAGTLEQWLECPFRWLVGHELDPQRLDSPPEQLTAGSIVHEVLERLYRDPPGDDRLPRPGDLHRWRERSRRLLLEVAEGQGLREDRPRHRIALARMRAQIEAFLQRESGSESELRPFLLEAAFGDREDCERPALELGDALRIHGKIDRVDVTPDRRLGVVHDYKTGSRVTSGSKLAEEGKLQLQVYARALRDLWGIEPIGALYHPLGKRGDPRPRGVAVKGAPELDGLALVGGDPVQPDDFEAALQAGIDTALVAAGEMREGLVDRKPIGGKCPPWCRYQPICRKERALLSEEGNGNGNGEGAA